MSERETPRTEARAREWTISPATADGLLAHLGVSEAPFAEQYHTIQRFMRSPDARAMPAKVRSELRNRNLLVRRGNDRIMECATLDDVRANIDRIDQALIDLLGERAEYVRQAAGFKRSAGEVAAPERVAQVLARVRELAQQRGMDPDLAVTIYEALIPIYIAAEETLFAPGQRGTVRRTRRSEE